MTTSVSELPALLDDIDTSLDEFSGAIDIIVRAAGAAMQLLPPVVASFLGDQLVRLRQTEQQLVTQVRSLLRHGGDPEALRAAGRAWADDIGASASRLAGQATLDRVRADDHWRGAAADAYRATLRPQQDALTALKAAADDIDSVLVELAEAILDFWVGIGAAVATLVATALAVAAEAAGVVTLPITVPTLIAGSGFFVTFLNSALDALTVITSTGRVRAAELLRRVGDDVAFPGGAWPRTTSDLGDGSLRDGDDTDWHLR